MYFFKKSGIYLFIILIIVSIYTDLTSGSLLPPNNNSIPAKQTEPTNTRKFKVKKVKVRSGDTVLSIVEEINDLLPALDINQIFDDFQLINHTNPHKLIIGDYYYFPIYMIIP
ncbi:hypothetical protein [Lentibacillus sp. Marseille-P4043]|uniref:hypothetical protein n=1 Tax=Lentibacillus sp. Marseille-P4043 TaxID=2040293 RepID=UPI000D0B7DE2|nr:hypothetical protein [Lentibacillus sp. Marseille-P4043]